ncbi:MAG: phosphoglycolate phosphatase [Steroidobacterales bacterium]
MPVLPRRRGVTLRAVLFDLDGTLLDTVDAIAAALNLALAESLLAPLGVAQVRDMIGRGAPLLIERALAKLGAPMGEAAQAVLLQRFLQHYECIEAGAGHSARVYPGVRDCLQQLHRQGLRLAVVTNKHKRLACGLLKRLALSEWIEVLIGGDSCARRKPDPQPLQLACEALQVEPAEALMVGDSLNDVLAARAAGVSVVCVPYGYNEGHDPRALACDALVETLAELPALLSAASRQTLADRRSPD